MLVIDDRNCPTLFPIGLCYQLGMILDTNTKTACLQRVGAKNDIHVVPTGHTSLNICELNPTTISSCFRSLRLPEQYKPQETVPEARTISPSVSYLPINHDDLWKELRDPFDGVAQQF